MMDPESALIGGEEQRPYRGFDYRSLLPGSSGTGSSITSGGGSYYFSQDNNGNEDPTSTASSRCCGSEYLPSLSWRERCLGCATCFLAGYLLGLGSTWRLKELLWHGNPIPFTVNATAGNALALAGSCFLSGPVAQYHKMWHPVRRTATLAYLGSLGVTLIVALSWGERLPIVRGMILMGLMAFQNLAIVWYTLSYVPYGHEAVQSCVRRWWNRNSMEY